MRKLFYSISMVLCAIFIFAGCSKDAGPPPPTQFTVTFNSNGGSEVAAVKVEEDKKLSQPTTPTNGNFIFAGWFKDAGLMTAWRFDTDVVTKNTTLYAKWTTITYTVTFNSNGGSAVEPATVAKGSAAIKPISPTKADTAFDDWYTDAALTNLFDFKTAVNSNITLYAKWSAIDRDLLEKLLSESYSATVANYTQESIDAMRAKQNAANTLLNSANPTAEQITTAYEELSQAMNALVALPHNPVVDIRIPNLIDGIHYFSPGDMVGINAYTIGNDGPATDTRITFKYDVAQLTALADGEVTTSDDLLGFTSKITIALGTTVTITATSVENPAIFKTITLKAIGIGALKTDFLNKVNSLPEPAKITYAHYVDIRKAWDIYNKLSYNEQQEGAVVTAYKKLEACDDAYSNLPERMKYSFNGNVCTMTPIYDNEEDEDESREFTFVANGAFPAGTYTQNQWEKEEKDENYYQSRLTIKSDGTGEIELRESASANGSSPTNWAHDSTLTYTNEGSKAKGGILYMTFNNIEKPIQPSLTIFKIAR